MQLLCGSALLPCPSTLKLFSLPVASGASLRLVLGDALRLALISTNNEVILYRYRKEGGRNRKRNHRIPRISPPLRFVLRLRLQKGGRICGTVRYYDFYPYCNNCDILL